jgi:hypothetical protein
MDKFKFKLSATIVAVALSAAASAQCAKFESSSTLVVEHGKNGRIFTRQERTTICVYQDEVHVESDRGFTVYKAKLVRSNGTHTFYTCDGCEVVVRWDGCEGCMVEIVDGPYNRYVYQNVRRV